MRPDKHKKKSHAAYAKKAAAKGGKNAVRSSPAQSKEEQRLPRHGIVEEQPHGPIKQPSENRCQVEQDDNRPSFSRRNVDSNWQQYEEIPEDDETLDQRGADFSLLLNQTAGSQFRFKDEEALDEDGTQIGISSILSFDCNQLAEKLQSISLPERLEISRVFFDRETLEILDQDAATSKPISVDGSSKSVLPPSILSKGDEAYFDQDLENLLSEPSTDNTRTSIPFTETKDALESVPRLDSDPASIVVKSQEQQSHQTNNSEEDVLDFLLSLSPTEKPNREEIPDVTRQIGEAVDRKPETNHVSLNDEVVVSDENTLPPQERLSSEKTESLDDWLDSILDD